MQKAKEKQRESALKADMPRQPSDTISVSSSMATTASVAPARPPSSSTRHPYSSNHMESSVTRLLVATKMLLECLTKWSVGQKTETQVSDVYVRLGNDFITARQAFSSYDIDMR